jgi:hypothetical protein
MGRLVTLCDSFQSTTSSDDNFIAKYALTSDVTWKSAWFSAWRSPFQPEAVAGSLAGGTVNILVNETAVFEMRIHGQIGQARHAYCVVIPWGTGLTFQNGQTMGWYLGTWNMQGIVAGGFIGEKI